MVNRPNKKHLLKLISKLVLKLGQYQQLAVFGDPLSCPVWIFCLLPKLKHDVCVACYCQVYIHSTYNHINTAPFLVSTAVTIDGLQLDYLHLERAINSNKSLN